MYVCWHSAEEGKKENERHLFYKQSTDNGKTFKSTQMIQVQEEGVCACCGMAASLDDNGRLLIVYRSATSSGFRNVMLLSKSKSQKIFSSVLIEKWKSATCPMSSFSLTVNGDFDLVAWENDSKVKFGFIKSGKLSKVCSPTLALKNQKYPQLLVLKNRNILFAWAEGVGWKRGGDLAYELFNADGSNTSERGVLPGLAKWSFIALLEDLTQKRPVIIY